MFTSSLMKLATLAKYRPKFLEEGHYHTNPFSHHIQGYKPYICPQRQPHTTTLTLHSSATHVVESYYSIIYMSVTYICPQSKWSISQEFGLNFQWRATFRCRSRPCHCGLWYLCLFQREWIWNTTWGSQPEPKPSY
jgi:hypothetical protein